MNTKNKSGKKLSPTRYFQLIDICSVIFVVIIALAYFPLSNNIILGLFSVLFCIVILYTIIRAPLDEFALNCRNKAAAAAFMSVLILMMIVPYLLGFGQGFYEGFTEAHNARVVAEKAGTIMPSQVPITWNLEDDVALYISIFVFLATFQWHRFRGFSA
jgi:hypothetical protein